MATQPSAPQDSTSPPSKLPTVSGVVTIEAPPYKGGTENSANPQLDLNAPSLKDTDQAWNLCKSTESSNKFRSERATSIELEYSGQPPFSAASKMEKAESWQSNVSTGILAGITDRKVLRFVNAITGQVYLTHSKLPVTWDEWKRKSDCFCNHSTKMIQGWKGYSTFLNKLAKENVLHGYSYAVFLDPLTWKPRCFKQDVAYVPDEAQQHASELQFFVIKHDYLLHEFLELFADEAAAQQLGYNVPNCVRAAAGSEVKNPREDMVTTEFRKFAEFIENGVMGLTYSQSGPRVVKTYLLWNREYDGRVSFWIINRDDGKLLRFASKIYPSMDEAVSLFSFQPGNGSLHSSKGLGRMLIGNVKIAEKLRNKMVDNVIMSSMLILKASSKDRNLLQPVVAAPFIVMDSSIDIPQQQFAADATGLAALDQKMNEYISQAGGAFITENTSVSSKPRTATAENIDFQRERENQDITESRWLDQFTGELVLTMQRRAFSDAHIEEAFALFGALAQGATESPDFYSRIVGDRDAVRTIVQMFKDGLTVEEIKYLRSAPTTQYADTDASITSQGILAVKKTMTGNPNIDQTKLDAMTAEALAGPDVARELVIPTPDQTLVAEASRMQMNESVTMSQLLMPVPVSPRDNHLIHGKVVVTILGGIGTKLSDLNVHEIEMKHFELNLNHLGEHLANYLQHGGVSQNPDYKALNDAYNQYKAQFTQVVNIHEHAKVAMQFGRPDMMHNSSQSAPPSTIGGGGMAGPSIAAGAPTASPDQFPESGADLDFKGGEKGVSPVLPAI